MEERTVRVVASYTTLPSRYGVLKESLKSLKNQTYKLDAVYVSLPKIASRLGTPYPPLPDDFGDLCTVVESEIDYGPITKIYGALVSESNPTTVIISCDDDVLFEPNFVEVLMTHHKKDPSCCVCGTGALIGKGLAFISIVSSLKDFRKWRWVTGFSVGPKGRNIDLVFGVGGVLYTRSMFPEKDNLYEELFRHSMEDKAIFHNDDVLISGYLSKKKIKKRLFLDIPEITHGTDSADALSADVIPMITRMEEAIQRVISLGYFTDMEELDVEETPAFKGLLFILMVILIILLSVCMYDNI